MLSITRRFAVPALAILLAERRVEAQSPTPILRIEAGMHVAPIKGISVDESGRLAMTVSMDKTARLWDVPLPTRLAPAVDAIGGNASLEGRATLLRVLRPPIDQSGEGALLAGALSPDGSLAAVGGYTGQERPDGCWIYLFESSSGRLVRQFSGLPGAIKHIAFSKQGSFLAATLLGGGLVVWEVASGREIGRDVDYGDSDTFGVDWQGEERMVTTCDDGKLRLYELHKVGIDREVWYIKSASVRGGQVPFTARFSPDGRQIAVGFADSANVAVVDGHDLHFLFAPDTSGVTNGCLSSVTWVDEDATATGHGQLSLAAGGTWNMREDENGIRLWPAAGRGKPEDRAAALNVIQDLRALPGGRILFGAQDPAWGEVDPESATDDLKSQWHGAPAAADFRGLARKFSLSRDGTAVAFAYEWGGESPAIFSVPHRNLIHKASDAKGLSNVKDGMDPPLYQGLEITGWEDAPAPKLAGEPLALFPHERSRSLAIARDAESFLLGTEWNLRCYIADGQQRWSLPAVGGIKAVNLADRDRLAVAACGDGTIRWHLADTGQELLALFPHADRKRWVLWTPQGYYDCSPGAEDLIGWHVNRGTDQDADFFPVARFRAIYYRPDIIQRVLQTRDVETAVRQADSVLERHTVQPALIAGVITELSPPVVEVKSGGVRHEVILPADSPGLDLSYTVRQTGLQQTTRVQIRANGRPLAVNAPVPRHDAPATVHAPLPPGFEGQIAVIASHALAQSEPATLRIRRSAPPAGRAAPKLFVLSVGVAELAMNQAPLPAVNTGPSVAKDRFQNLEFAAEDARKVGAILSTQKNGAFRDVETMVLVNQQATTSVLRQALRGVAAKADSGDVVFIFYSGHANHDPETGRLHLVTHDTDPKREAATALSGGELSELLGEIRGYVVMALDACYSGAVLGMQLGEKYKAPPLDISGLANQLSSAEHGIVMLSSSTPDQISFEDRNIGGGLFTKGLLEGLAGKAANESGAVSCGALMKWIDQRLPELVSEGTGPTDEPRISQTPVTVMPQGVPDFVISRP